MEGLLLEIIGGIILLWLGSMEWRFRSMSETVRNLPDKEDVTHEIELKNESLKVLQNELKEDISRIERKLDILIQGK